MRGLAKYGIIVAFIPIVAHGADAPIPHHAAKYCVHEGKKCRVGDICHSHGWGSKCDCKTGSWTKPTREPLIPDPPGCVFDDGNDSPIPPDHPPE